MRTCAFLAGPGAKDDLSCKNFRRPNITSSAPRRRALLPSLRKLWRGGDGGGAAQRPGAHIIPRRMSRDAHARPTTLVPTALSLVGGPWWTTPVPGAGGGSCAFVAEMALDGEAHALAGAPSKLVVSLNVSSDAVLSWELVQARPAPSLARRRPRHTRAPAALRSRTWPSSFVIRSTREREPRASFLRIHIIGAQASHAATGGWLLLLQPGGPSRPSLASLLGPPREPDPTVPASSYRTSCHGAQTSANLVLVSPMRSRTPRIWIYPDAG